MSVTNETNKVNYAATGLSSYAIPFFFSSNSNIKLYIDDVEKVIDVDYSVTGEGDESGGDLTLLITPPTSGVISIIREVPLKQLNSFNEGGQFSSRTLEGMFDRLTFISQQIDEKTDRAIKMPLSATGLDPQITGTATPGAILRLNDAADGLELGLNIESYQAILDATVDEAQDAQAAAEAAQAIAESAAETAADDVSSALAIFVSDAEAAQIAAEAAQAAAEAAQISSEAAQAAAELAASEAQAIAVAGVFYFGDPVTDGTWRIYKDGANLKIQLRVTGSWETRDTFTP